MIVTPRSPLCAVRVRGMLASLTCCAISQNACSTHVLYTDTKCLFHSRAAGAVTDRTRRIMKEVSTLPGQLPLEWESSIFVGMDTDRMDVLR